MTAEVTVTEQDVGIGAYVNTETKGFESILKYRCEDFLVNEVDMEGNIVRLTSMDAPMIPCVEKIILSDDALDQEVARVTNVDFSKQFRELLNTPNDYSLSAVTKVDMSRSDRIAFYTVVDKHITGSFITEYIDNTLTARWKKPDEPELKKDRVNFNTTPGEYIRFYVQKSGIDTPGAFGYAGSKDARAITVQEMTLHKCDPRYVYAMKDALTERGIYIGNYEFVTNGLTLGDLSGNHFTIVLRNVTGASEEDIVCSLKSLQEHGFLNYFGMQRFGTSSIGTHEIGRALLAMDYEKASDLMLMPRSGDRPDYAEAREYWKTTRDPAGALSRFPGHAFAEKKLLISYTRYPNDHERAFRNLPKNNLTLYYHAYQSYIWNSVVTERIRLYGHSKPMVGDLVLAKKTGTVKPRGDSNAGKRDPSTHKEAIALKEEDLASYTIWDVVYPVPGSRSKFPKNAVYEIYKELLAKDNIDISKLQNSFKKFSGDYRHMMSKPKNMSWKFIRYNDPESKLFNTDHDKLVSVPEPKSIDGMFFDPPTRSWP
ncbi:pseudouridine synthase [Spinellus fusiger]|nr:pseudouridine synthase [Spinellus fusiger]